MTASAPASAPASEPPRLLDPLLSDDLAQISAGQVAGIVLLAAACVVLLYLLHRFLFPPPPGPSEPPLWGGSEVLLVIGVWILAEVGFAIVLGSLRSSLTLGESILAVQVGARGVTIAYLFLMVRRFCGQPLSTLGLRRPPLSSVVPTILVYVISHLPVVAVSILWSLALVRLGFELQTQAPIAFFREYLEEGDVRSAVALVVGGAVIAPCAEELVFRGLVFGWLRRRFGALPGAVLSSALFGVVHLSLMALAPIFVLGLLLAYVYHRSGSLWVAVAYHAAFNGVTFAALAFSEP